MNPGLGLMQLEHTVSSVRGMQARLLALTSAIEAAIAAGNSASLHQIVPSRDFDRMMDNLHQAAELLDQVAVEREAGVVIAFRRPNP